MKLHQYIIAIIITIEIIICFLLYDKKQDFAIKYYQERAEKFQIKDQINRSIIKFRQTLFSDHLELANVDLKNLNSSKSEKVKLHAIIKEPVIIYRFSERSCKACVEQDIKDLKTITRTIGINKVLYICKYKELLKAKAYLRSLKININCYNYNGEFNLPMENDTLEEPPFFFVTDTSKKVKLPYKTDDNDTLNKIYFQKIKNYFGTH